jgi:hypothetical protein
MKLLEENLMEDCEQNTKFASQFFFTISSQRFQSDPSVMLFAPAVAEPFLNPLALIWCTRLAQNNWILHNFLKQTIRMAIMISLSGQQLGGHKEYLKKNEFNYVLGFLARGHKTVITAWRLPEIRDNGASPV